MEPDWTLLALVICFSSSQRLCMSHTITSQAAKTFYDSHGSQSAVYLGALVQNRCRGKSIA